MDTTNDLDIAIETAMRLIQKWEGFRAEAYRCPAGVLTIGWGRTGGVLESDRTTMQAEEVWLRKRVAEEVQFVRKALKDCPLTLSPQQVAALASLVYNIGKQAFLGSGVRGGLINGDTALAVSRWSQWNKAGGAVSKGLVRRRADEVALFLTA